MLPVARRTLPTLKLIGCFASAIKKSCGTTRSVCRFDWPLHSRTLEAVPEDPHEDDSDAEAEPTDAGHGISLLCM